MSLSRRLTDLVSEGKPASTLPRVAVVCRLLWNGGVQRVAIEQTRALRDIGLDCDLVFLRRVENSTYLLPDGTRILSLSDSTRGEANAILRSVTGLYAGHRGQEATVDLDLIFRARRAIRAYDIVIYNDQYAALAGVWNRLTAGQPYVLMFHEFFPRVSKRLSRKLLYPLASLLDATSILLAPGVVTTSTKIYARLSRIVPGRVFLARLASPAPRAVARDLQTTRKRVLSVTVWDRGRHPELIIEVAKLLPEFEFTIAGFWAEEAFRAEVEKSASMLPNVLVTGTIPEDQLKGLYESNLIFMRFGYGESGPGMGGLEALSFGCIVIANEGLGIAEVIRDGVDGFIASDLSPGTIATLLRRIDAMDDATLGVHSEHALKLAGQLSWHEHGRVLTEAIKSVLRQKADGTFSPVSSSVER
ncbi:MAG: glycosyltransferase family 4 protein [Nitrososphaerales archaeon]